jgi:hypothetical protein
MNFCLGPFALVLHAYAAAATYAKARVGLGQVTSEGSKWKLTSDLCFWLLQRKGKRGSGGSKWRPEAKANKNKNPRLRCSQATFAFYYCNAKATGEANVIKQNKKLRIKKI